MFNFTLYRREMKKSWIMLAIFGAVITMYVSIMVSMYDPEQMKLLEEWGEAFGSMMAAVGMTAGAATYIGFIANYLYGFILIAIPMIFSILCGNRLLAGYVDKGSMVGLLAAPVKRRTVAFTQMKVLATGLVLLTVYATVLEIAVAHMTSSGELDVAKLLLLNLGLLCLHFFIGGICFFFSALANDTKFSIGLGAGIPALMFILKMLANTGGHAENAKYFTFFSLFSPDQIIAGETFGIAGMLILLAGAAALFIAAIAVFEKKDLHI